MISFDDMRSGTLISDVSNGYIPEYAVILNSKGVLVKKKKVVIALDPDSKVTATMYTSDCKVDITIEFSNTCERDVAFYTSKLNKWLNSKSIPFDYSQSCYEQILRTPQDLSNLKKSFKRLGRVLVVE